MVWLVGHTRLHVQHQISAWPNLIDLQSKSNLTQSTNKAYQTPPRTKPGCLFVHPLTYTTNNVYHQYSSHAFCKFFSSLFSKVLFSLYFIASSILIISNNLCLNIFNFYLHTKLVFYHLNLAEASRPNCLGRIRPLSHQFNKNLKDYNI